MHIHASARSVSSSVNPNQCDDTRYPLELAWNLPDLNAAEHDEFNR